MADIVLFAVKLYGAAEAARSAAPLFGPQTLGISLLNGIDGQRNHGPRVARPHGGRRLAYVSAVIAAPGKLRYTSDMSAINSARLRTRPCAPRQRRSSTAAARQVSKPTWSTT